MIAPAAGENKPVSVSPVKTIAILGVAYLVVARWKALHPAPGAARMVGPSLDLAWPVSVWRAYLAANPR